MEGGVNEGDASLDALLERVERSCPVEKRPTDA